MDIAEKKKEYDALTALSNWVGYAATALLIIGILWTRSFNILVMIGFLGFLAGTSLQLYARYRFGLIKSFYWWLAYQILLVILVLGILLVPLIFNISG